MDLSGHDDLDVDSPRGHDADLNAAHTQCSDGGPGGVVACEDVEDTKEVEVGQRSYDSEGALCRYAEKGGLTLKGQINLGGQMEITHHTMQDNRTITKHVHHHQGDLHQHQHNQYVKEGDVIHYHGEVHQAHHVHYKDTEAGYEQIKHQSELAMLSDEKVFVETWAFRTALEQISEGGFLLLTGPSGSGKTCISHALLRHHRTLGYTPLVLHRFEEWRSHVGGDRQQAILLEDIFGKDQFQGGSFSDWIHCFPTIQQLATSGKCIIVITVNSSVLDAIQADHGPCSLFGHTLNLATPDARLSEDEKKRILQSHLEQAGKSLSETSLEEVVQSANSEVLFPVSCKLFAGSPLDEKEALKVFMTGATDNVSTCGTGPKVFFWIAPDILKKSLLKPTKKVATWGYVFTNNKGDIWQVFNDDAWTTQIIQHVIQPAETDTTKGSHSDRMTASPLHKPEEGLASSADAGEALVRFESACRKGESQSILNMMESEAALSLCQKTSFTALHVAALAAQADTVEILLDHEFSVHAADKHGWTPLHVACYRGHREIAEHLIRHGAKLELATNCGMRALHIACRYGHTQVVQLLLQNGSTTEARSDGGNMACPIHMAAFYGHAQVIELLVKYGAQTNVRDRCEWLPLHYACQQGHLRAVEALLTACAPAPSSTAQIDQLQVSCQNGHIHLVRNLLQCGLCTRDPGGKTAVCRSCFLSNKLPLENLSRHPGYPDNPGNRYLTALFLATQNGHCEVVDTLLKAGACTELRMSGGWTPLLLASYKGHHHIVKQLLQYKTDVNDSLDNVLLTPLHLASAKGRKETVEVLLQHGAMPDMCDNYGHSPLHKACINGHSNVLPSLLARVKDLYSDEESAGKLISLASTSGNVDVLSTLQEWFPNIFETVRESPVLHEACKHGHLEIVKILLRHNFPVNTPSSASAFRGETPIHVASEKGRAVIVEALISSGAKTDEKTPHGSTALHIACRAIHADVVKVLLEKGSADTEMKDGGGQTPLHVAASMGLDDIVTLLVAFGADVNVQDAQGQTPLICGRRSSVVVDILLNNKADASVKAADGETILHKVCRYGNEPVLHTLLSHGVNLETKDKDGETALFRACRAAKNNSSMVKLLLESGADAQATADQGMSPLHLACHLGEEDLLHQLLQHGGRANSRNSKGETPLHQACMQGHSRLTEVLLQAGALVHEPDHHGNTPLHTACAHLQPDSVKTLLHHEADTSIKNKDGLSPLNLIQSKKLSDGQLSEEDRHQRNNRKTEIMFAFMESNQYFADKNSHALAQGTIGEKRENSMEDEKASTAKLRDGPTPDEDDDTAIISRPTQGTDTADSEKMTENEPCGHEEDSVIVHDQMVLEEQDASSNENLIGTEPATQTTEFAGVVNPGSFPNEEAGDEWVTSPEELPPFHKACLQGNMELVLHKLLTSGNNIDDVSKSGRTALHCACAAGHHDIAALLLQHGASAATTDPAGQTCLHVASFHGHLGTVDLLLSQGLDANVADGEGRTALHLASSQGQALVTALLVCRGANMNLADDLGNTPLMLACDGNRLDVCVVLCNSGADLEHRNNLGKGVCDIVKTRNLPMLEKLIARHTLCNMQPSTKKMMRQERRRYLILLAVIVSAFLACVVAVCLTWL